MISASGPSIVSLWTSSTAFRSPSAGLSMKPIVSMPEVSGVVPPQLAPIGPMTRRQSWRSVQRVERAQSSWSSGTHAEVAGSSRQRLSTVHACEALHADSSRATQVSAPGKRGWSRGSTAATQRPSTRHAAGSHHVLIAATGTRTSSSSEGRLRARASSVPGRTRRPWPDTRSLPPFARCKQDRRAAQWRRRTTRGLRAWGTSTAC
jgi:hypothetical protein